MERPKKNTIGFCLLFCLFIFFLNCSIKPAADEEVNPSQLAEVERDPASVQFREIQSSFYLNKVQPIFNSRCVVCHACTEAPCSLYLHSYDAVLRGALTDSKLVSTVFANQPIRMKDGKTLTDWQKKGFSKVVSLDKPSAVPNQNLDKSLLYRYVDLGANNNVGAFGIKSAEKYIEDGKVCPADIKSYNELIKSHSYIGMPFALPSLNISQLDILKKWAESGAVGPSESDRKAMALPINPTPIIQWEQFLNGASPKNKLTARYIYEHTFISHVHFEGTPQNEFFELIRSKTNYPDTPVEIVTERPNDDPKVGVFYYRFKKITETIVRKTHIVIDLDHNDLDRWKKSFLESDWGSQNISLVDYKSKNPFEYFRQIPAIARYSFLLDKSYTIANSMIRGSVCTGKRATYAIRDHFWVMFLDPQKDPSVVDPDIGEREWIPLSTSKEDRDNIIKKLIKADSNNFSYSTNMIWNGDGNNPNALLTIFRHELSASVTRGFVGKLPNTVWVLNFSNFERMFYNLVVEFIPWGSAAHQYSTWRAMTYHRQEAEERLLMFFNPEARPEIRNIWKESLSELASDVLNIGDKNENSSKSGKNLFPIQALVGKVLGEMPKKVVDNINPYYLQINTDYQPNDFIDSIEKWDRELNLINTLQTYKYARYLPNIIYLKVDNQAYTILSNRAYKFNDSILGMNLAYEPKYDTMSILKGIYGDRPELFIELSLNDCSLFLKRLLALNSESDWVELKKRYAVRRNDAKIWNSLDWFSEFDRTTDLLESGVIDMNQYDITTW